MSYPLSIIIPNGWDADPAAGHAARPGGLRADRPVR